MVGNDVCGETGVVSMKMMKLPFLLRKYINSGLFNKYLKGRGR